MIPALIVIFMMFFFILSGLCFVMIGDAIGTYHRTERSSVFTRWTVMAFMMYIIVCYAMTTVKWASPLVTQTPNEPQLIEESEATKVTKTATLGAFDLEVNSRNSALRVPARAVHTSTCPSKCPNVH